MLMNSECVYVLSIKADYLGGMFYLAGNHRQHLDLGSILG